MLFAFASVLLFPIQAVLHAFHCDLLICHCPEIFGKRIYLLILTRKNIHILNLLMTLRKYIQIHRSSHHRYSMKKGVLSSQNSQESTCARVSFLIKLQASPCIFIKKDTLVQVFSRKFCKISKKNFLKNTFERMLLETLVKYTYSQ